MCYVQFKIDIINFELSLTSYICKANYVKFKIYNFELQITHI